MKRRTFLVGATAGLAASRLAANRLAARLLGNTIYANVLMLGYAWQKGLIPLAERSLLRAIELNQLNFELRRSAIRVAIEQVELARLRLQRPPRLEEPADQQLGATTARDLVSALHFWRQGELSPSELWRTALATWVKAPAWTKMAVGRIGSCVTTGSFGTAVAAGKRTGCVGAAAVWVRAGRAAAVGAPPTGGSSCTATVSTGTAGGAAPSASTPAPAAAAIWRLSASRIWTRTFAVP